MCLQLAFRLLFFTFGSFGYFDFISNWFYSLSPISLILSSGLVYPTFYSSIAFFKIIINIILTIKSFKYVEVEYRF